MSSPAMRSIPQLISDATADVGHLVTDIKALAKAETADAARKGGIGVALIVAALGVAWFALVALTIAFGFGLVALGLPIWASFLIVFGVFLLAAAGMVFGAISLFKRIKAPERTMAAIKSTFSSLSGATSDEDAAGRPAEATTTLD